MPERTMNLFYFAHICAIVVAFRPHSLHASQLSAFHLLPFPPSHLPTFSSSHLLIFPPSHLPTFSSSHLLTF
ncbi:hypothetical protein D1AOALGA4SA_8613 [Olavius algarvensis Delta 1 endosymbiont]|nr:hypothetical protein D1AOALGA4SA_8613 [Olavius algarvensis Delta 1 endosymbiont]